MYLQCLRLPQGDLFLPVDGFKEDTRKKLCIVNAIAR